MSDQQSTGARVVLAGRDFLRGYDLLYRPVAPTGVPDQPLVVVNEAAPVSHLAALLQARAAHLSDLVNLLDRSGLENSTPAEVLEVVTPLADEVRLLAELVAEATARRDRERLHASEQPAQ